MTKRIKQIPTKLTLGQRISRLRKARGITQTELAESIGTTQTMVSEYEQNHRRLHAQMIVHIAQTLNVSTDELLDLKLSKFNGDGEFSLKLTRRLKKIHALPPTQQKTLLQTIDAFLKGVAL